MCEREVCMVRFTKAAEDGSRYFVEESSIYRRDGGYRGLAIDKLAMFENCFEDLLRSQDELLNEMKLLRKQKEIQSDRFRRLMIQKKLQGNLIAHMRQYGVHSPFVKSE